MSRPLGATDRLLAVLSRPVVVLGLVAALAVVLGLGTGTGIERAGGATLGRGGPTGGFTLALGTLAVLVGGGYASICR